MITRERLRSIFEKYWQRMNEPLVKLGLLRSDHHAQLVVAVRDKYGQPIPGHVVPDCVPMTTDGVEHLLS